MRKILLWVVAILLSPLLLFIILAVALYLPPVQNWAVHKVADVASEKTGMFVSVDKVRLAFPLDLSVSGFKAIQPNDSLPQVRDTIADVATLVVNLQLRPLFDKRVVINTLDLKDAKINTVDFVAAARVKGSLGRLFLTSRGIDLDHSTVDVTNALLDGADFDVALSDTVPPDTSTTKNLWKIYIYNVDVANSNVALHMPGDTLQIRAHLGKASVENGVVDLENEIYSVGNVTLANASINYDNVFEPRLKGLDYNHIAITDIGLSIDSIYYKGPEARLMVRHCQMKEKSGLELTGLSGPLTLDSLQLCLPSLVASTPDSRVEAQMTMALNVMDSINPGNVKLRLLASLGKQDIMRFAGDMPQQLVRKWPNHPLTLRASVNGNLRDIEFTGVDINLPTAFQLSADGEAHNPTDLDRLRADVKVKGRTGDLGFATCLLDPAVMSNYRIPSGISLDVALKARGRRYDADVKLREAKGKVAMKGYIDTRSMAYSAKFGIDQLNLHHFMPHDSIYTLTADLSADGRGFDFLSKSCLMKADATIKHLGYGHLNINKVVAAARLSNGVAHVGVDSHNALLDGTVNLDALVSNKRVDATLGTDLRKADLHALRLTEVPMTVGACAHVDVASDLKQSHALKGTVDDMTVATEKKTYRPADLIVDMLTNRDTTWANVSSGNFEMRMKASGGYEKLMAQGQALADELQQHLRNKIIDQAKIRTLLPVMSLHLASGSENPFANYLRMKGVGFEEMKLDFKASPLTGLNGDGYLHSLLVDSVRLDTIDFRVTQDSSQVHFFGRVENNKRNKQFVFKTLFDGEVIERGANLNLRYYDADDKLGVSLGAKAEMLDSGINVHFTPYRPVLGYKEFNLNKDNYVFLGRNKRISAKLDIVADDGTGVKAYTNDDNADALQDVTVSLNKFDLEKITSVMPYAPRVDGLLNGDFHVVMGLDEKISVLSDLSVAGMSYEHCPIGDISSEFVYLQRDSNSHFVDASLNRNGVDVGTLKGTYTARASGDVIDAKLNLTRTPMSMVNGFIPDQLFGIIGYAEGEVDVKGLVSSPQVDGEIYLDSAFLVSVPYGMHLRLDDDPVRVVGSNLLLENFTLYAHNDNPLNIAGNIDFSNLDKITMALRMKANDYLLIDSKKTSRSVAYGKAYVNFFGGVNGDLDNLSMKGKLDVLGKTDLSYVLTSSPLNTDDQLKGLVTFTDFRDTTTQVEVAKPPINGLDMQLMVNVESGARVFCALNADQSNYVNVEGEGELRMVYNTTDDLQLFGRYTMTDGEMKYSLPVIPLKTFHIKEGSYVEFSGDVMNPRLNIEATEEVKSSVSSDNGGSRTVLFDCGVKVTQTLNNMGLEFTLDAPEDMTIKNELATMSTEARGRVAVTMLTTGMYLADGNTGNFSMNSALNTFLQSEINNITSNALRTTDISLGMDQNSDASGNTYTDYSFKFAKRFWNNRINFVIGGKISDASGSAGSGQSNTFIDNVSLEYRLDQSAQRYVRLFYNKEAQDLLEDRISEYGAGFVWRKKMDRLRDLFRFGNNNSAVAEPLKRDTTTINDEKK